LNRVMIVILAAAVPIAALFLLYWPDYAGKKAETKESAAARSVFLETRVDTDAFARATEPGAIEIPADRGPHEDYQTEWWYYTGNLSSEEGRRFGYQLTFFRRALTPPGHHDALSGDNTPSAWRTNQIYLAHFAVSDIDNGRFYHAESFARGAMELAGAAADPYAVWLEDWHATSAGPGVVQLHARTDKATLDLRLKQTLPPILHGDAGLSAKGPDPGNASYYYSIVRQETGGTLFIDGREYDVSGLSWKDHEYSTSVLPEDATGWDWFSLQFDDGTALMFFRMRLADGTLEDASSGTFIHSDGTTTPLKKNDWETEITDTWKSPYSGAVYPVGWRIEIGPVDLEITGGALMNAQEMRVSTTYWEGAVAFEGTRKGRPVSAEGYLEMTGYAETMAGRL